MITDKTRELLADYFKLLVTGGTLTDTGGNNIGTISAGSAKIGVGGNTTSPLALDLDVPLTTVTPTAQKTGENVIQVMLEEVGSNIASKLIREMGIFDNDGKMLGRVNFEAVGPFSGTERIQIFLTLEVE